jgi:hypothetical protein
MTPEEVAHWTAAIEAPKEKEGRTEEPTGGGDAHSGRR